MLHIGIFGVLGPITRKIDDGVSWIDESFILQMFFTYAKRTKILVLLVHFLERNKTVNTYFIILLILAV